MNLNEIIERFPEETFLKADGFDEAILGVETNSMRLIYSVKKCINILCREMNPIEAFEYFEFNVVGAYLGEQTPIFCYDVN